MTGIRMATPVRRRFCPVCREWVWLGEGDENDRQRVFKAHQKGHGKAT